MMRVLLLLLLFSCQRSVGQEYSEVQKLTKNDSLVNEYSADYNFFSCFVNGIPASFPGGMVEFNKMFFERFLWPIDTDEITKVRIVFSFVVQDDGSLTDIVLLKNSIESINIEAKRVLLSMPNWIPEIYNSKKVRSTFTLPLIIVKK